LLKNDFCGSDAPPWSSTHVQSDSDKIENIYYVLGCNDCAVNSNPKQLNEMCFN